MSHEMVDPEVQRMSPNLSEIDTEEYFKGFSVNRLRGIAIDLTYNVRVMGNALSHISTRIFYNCELEMMASFEFDERLHPEEQAKKQQVYCQHLKIFRPAAIAVIGLISFDGGFDDEPESSYVQVISGENDVTICCELIMRDFQDNCYVLGRRSEYQNDFTGFELDHRYDR